MHPYGLLSLLLLSMAVSLDGFGVGITYGLRKIRIPVVSVLIISVCSGLIILLSMMVGVALSSWLSPRGASALGAVILIGIGGWALIRFLQNRQKDNEEPSAGAPEAEAQPSPPIQKRALITLELRRMGIIIQILRTPSAADMDRSGIITTGEAFLLGIALSLDAFGAGIGAALVGYSPVITAVLIATTSGIFLWLGMRVGFLVAGMQWVRRLSILPGIILIIMGIMKLL
ncbi:sporulation membrane protein YtaF [Cohnella thailandensis]|uniref:Sporulation membrane protein YtaF n=1 Tax=Cohnella thailandensis TaxID=557557 RepID=A0A841SZA5_9BACL|nr:sporulation membrane protein YtaF [Cohnella thailandensis]MBB6635966.1 sporulation membrane protein YtaF [Cohnella thailandensis]MBP1976344.1 putative sporulation protein YtaF [Cohnella thailandensis]